MKNEIFAIGIPTINRLDLLDEAVNKYIFDFPNTLIFIVDNGRQNIYPLTDNVKVRTMDENIGVAASWNIIADEVFYNHDISNLFLLNDDIYWGKKEAGVIEFIKNNQREDFILTLFEWCNFMLPISTWEKVGKFDHEYYPAYWEDKDYAYRMKLAGITPFVSTFMNPKVYNNSMSIEKDRTLDKNFDKNKWRYIRKWGGLPGNEKYTAAFGE